MGRLDLIRSFIKLMRFSSGNNQKIILLARRVFFNPFTDDYLRIYQPEIRRATVIYFFFVSESVSSRPWSRTENSVKKIEFSSIRVSRSSFCPPFSHFCLSDGNFYSAKKSRDIVFFLRERSRFPFSPTSFWIRKEWSFTFIFIRP